MQVRVGYDIRYTFPQPTPLMVVLSIHYSRASDLLRPDHLHTEPSLPIEAYRDGFGNWCSRLLAPAGTLRLSADTVISDSGLPDMVAPYAEQVPIQTLPADVLAFLLPSRYCESDRLSRAAWDLFSGAPLGWGRVQAICDFVHRHVKFGYAYADPTKTAWSVFDDGRGVCRDFAHLAIALCRCMNIPARYCTGYLGDIGVPASDAPMDFSAWFEAYLGGQWYTFDARHNVPRIARVLIARGRDAADVAITTTFGPSKLDSFFVRTDEIVEDGSRSGGVGQS